MFLTYRQATQTAPVSTTTAAVPLTNIQVDGNWKSISDALPWTIFTGPATSHKTFTLPNATCTILTTNAAVTVGQGGTGATTFTANNVLLGNGTSALQVVAPSTSGNVLTSNGTTWQSTAPAASGATISDDTTTNRSQYLGMSTGTSGAWTAAYVASTKLYFNPSTGTLNSTIFNSLSDISQKTNIKIVTNAVDTVKKLEGVEFNWIETGLKSSGTIAQKLEEVLPHLVATQENGLKTVNYAGLSAYLIEAVKELSARIEELENK